MSTKHTPGPWKWDGDPCDYDPSNEAPWIIAGALDEIAVLSGEVCCNSPADAQLMVSAPELLAALQASEKALSEALTLLMNSGLVVVDTGDGELMDVEGAVGRIDAAIDSAREVIAKATGEQQ